MPKSDTSLREAILQQLYALYGVNKKGELFTYEENDQYQKAADALLALYKETALAAVGEDEPCYDPETGKEVTFGHAVTIDVVNNTRKSLIFIESNGKNNVRRDIRANINKQIGEV